MIKKIILCLFCFTLPMLCFSQRGKKQDGFTFSVTTSLNYYPKITPYKFINKYSGTISDQIILDFVTRNSGTFTLEEGEPISITRTHNSEFPTHLLGLGTSVRLMNESGLFHELSITKFSFFKSTHNTEYLFVDTMDVMNLYNIGYNENSTVFAFRYELGKLFGKKRSKIKFGLGGGIEPSFYFYKRTPLSLDGHPIKANIITLDFSLVPMLSATLSKKVSLDLKVISNFLFADFGTIRENNPAASPNAQKGVRDYNLPEITMSYNLMLRYNLSDPKKRR